MSPECCRHQVEYLQLAPLRPLEVLGDCGRVLVGRLRQAREKSRLRERQVLGALAKVALGGDFRTVGVVSVEDLIEVPRQDLVVLVAAFELEGDDRLLDLPRDTPVGPRCGVHVDIPRQLLCDAAAAAPLEESRAEGREVLEDRACRATEVDARVVEEARIFRRDRCGDQIGRHLAERYRMAQPS